MAQHKPRPGRRLIMFALAVLVLYGGIALGDHAPNTKGHQLGGQWQPKLGLDLQGGTRITLAASTSTGQKVTPTNLEEARSIIDQRVNGTGVTEASVVTQGSDNIVVEVPGPPRGTLVDAVKQTAQLRFRLVAAQGAGQPAPAAAPSSGASASPSPSPSAGAPSATASPDSAQTAKPKATPTAKASATPKGRALSSGLIAADPVAAKATATPKPRASAKPTPKAASPTASVDPSAAASALAGAAATGSPTPTAKGAPVDKPLQWKDNPGSGWLKKFTAFRCPTGRTAPAVEDISAQPLVTCDQEGNKYLLSAAMIEGTQLKNAQAAPPNQQYPTWTVDLSFKGDARKTFATVTQAIANRTSPLTGQPEQFAIVLDGKVITSATAESVINTGSATISGSTFTSTSALSLANSLKYGALPLKFQVPVVSLEGPTLASNQLTAGLIAGGIGLALVLLYCLLYYRGLGLVVVASLAVAAAVTYAAVLVMSQAVAFTLTLPGIAGLIVAVGITADSFIVYFERIRDEMRNGKSMRVAVEAGWVRARATCLAADSVSLLAAVVLYIFSIGVVKGFAFTLGISTVIDLVVFFLFTKPMVSWLATFRFFYSGHKWSGLSPDHVGSPRLEERALRRPAQQRPTGRRPLGGKA